jgi:hypothetical protein
MTHGLGSFQLNDLLDECIQHSSGFAALTITFFSGHIALLGRTPYGRFVLHPFANSESTHYVVGVYGLE